MFPQERADMVVFILRGTNVMMFLWTAGYSFTPNSLPKTASDTTKACCTTLLFSKLLHEAPTVCAFKSRLRRSMLKLSL
jgi:hypothetical protein